MESSPEGTSSFIEGGARKTPVARGLLAGFCAGVGAGSSGGGKGELLVGEPPPKPNGKGERMETGEIFSISESAEPFLLGLAGIRGAASFDESLGVNECERVCTW